jgi:AbrB family looped-hinge helix DNA binding protein
MSSTTLSAKYQIVIPKDVRKKLSLSPRDKLEVSLSPDQTYLIVKPVIENWPKHARGLGKEIWREVDTKKYHQEFRESLERNN